MWEHSHSQHSFSRIKKLLLGLIVLYYFVSKTNGQVDCKKSEESWCPHFKSYCNNPQFRAQMLSNCARTCQVCAKTTTDKSQLCNDNNGGCEQLCASQANVVTCSCRSGYYLSGNGKNCIDSNECADPNTCRLEPTKRFCTNTRGSYFCSNTNCSATSGYHNRYQSGICCQEDPNSNCGVDSVSDERIVGGKDATIGGWPWMVYVLIDDRLLCGGTLISDTWVVTAGHCFREATSNTTVKAFFGRHDPYASKLQEPDVQVREVIEVVLHDQWIKEKFPYHDIALMRLNASVKYNKIISPICLPNGETPKTGTRCWVTGYGTTAFRGNAADVLQEVDLPIIEIDKCSEVYKDTEFPINKTIMLCAGYPQGKKDSCQGDSGGPLVCQRCSSCRWYLAGVVSFGKGCARAGFYGVYTDVEYHEEWISRITGIQVTKDKSCDGQKITKWSQYGQWSECSKSCLGGSQQRTRRCLNRVVGKSECTGLDRETRNCNQNKLCPSWNAWNAWSECDKTCNGGQMSRKRTCQNGKIGDIGCEAKNAEQKQECNAQNCPTWRPWSTWSSCSKTCGEGTKSSSRTCNTFGVSEATCVGENSRTEKCTEKSCPRWGSWSAWTGCSVSCNGGKRSKSRICLNDNPQKTGCQGSNTENENCNTQICGTWSKWGKWSKCSKSCLESFNGSPGSQTSTRICVGGTAGIDGCPGESSQTRTCNTHLCPEWTTWGKYSKCSKTCDIGKKSRSRVCQNQRDQRNGCPGSAEESVSCNTQKCPVWRQWSDWLECSRRCGGGRRNSTRSCMRGKVGDQGCIGQTVKYEDCNIQPCPEWTKYSSWSSCNATCGFGYQTRTRQCLNGKPGDVGCDVGTATDKQTCNTHSCPHWSAWKKSESCSKTCSQGQQNEVRTCLDGNVGQIGCVGPSKRTTSCKIADCPSIWLPWSEFGECSVTCGSGKQSRSRKCQGTIGSSGCTGTARESKTCGEPCRTRWSNWNNWSTCTKTCFGGSRSRTRTCIDGTIGQPGCSPSNQATQTDVCNDQACPACSDVPQKFCQPSFCNIYFQYVEQYCKRTCNLCNLQTYGEWLTWSACTASCGGGQQTRSRACFSVTGICNQDDLQWLRKCNTQACSGYTQWSSWTQCDESCGTGSRSRTRTCPKGIVCSPDQYGSKLSDTEPCNTQSCPGTWGDWGDYGSCTTTCGAGKKSRERKCIGGKAGGPGCEGSNKEDSDCKNSPCPGKWSKWRAKGACSVTCGSGTKIETRTCKGGTPGLPNCIGATERNVKCSLGKCITQWSVWNTWSDCSVTCGEGNRTRNRNCENGKPGDKGCIGDAIATEECNIQVCTPGSSGSCGGMIDLFGPQQCSQLALFCNNPSYKTYMEQNCRKTCCKEGCKDFPGFEAYCLNAKQNNFCGISLQAACRKTCGFC